MPHITADRDVILANTQSRQDQHGFEAKQRVLRHVSVRLVPANTGDGAGAYKAKDKDRFQRLVMAAGAGAQ